MIIIILLQFTSEVIVAKQLYSISSELGDTFMCEDAFEQIMSKTFSGEPVVIVQSAEGCAEFFVDMGIFHSQVDVCFGHFCSWSCVYLNHFSPFHFILLLYNNDIPVRTFKCIVSFIACQLTELSGAML